MQSPRDLIKEVTEFILTQPDQYGLIFQRLQSLHNLYAGYTGVYAHNINDSDIWLPSGNAVSTTKAAHCLLEFQRTAVFMRGIYKALKQLQKDFPGEKLHILYAGCGPYATLLTPFTSLFTADEVAFHLMDVNTVTLDAAKQLYESLGLTDYIAEYICTDATTYCIPEGTMIHLCVCEAMLNALRKEPQVDITLNLVPQLHEKALFIPHDITVTAQLLDNKKESVRDENWKPDRMNLGAIYKIGRESCKVQERTLVQIPEAPGGYNHLNLLTDINTFDDEVLTTYESSISMPLRIGYVNGYEGKQIAFTYQRGEKPGFVYEWQ